MIDLYKEATQEAYDGAVTTFWLLGLANGSNYFVFLLTYIIVTLFGTWLLYDNVEESGCDPSGTVSGNDRCDPAGLDIFGALMGVSFSAAVLPQISVAIEALSGEQTLFLVFSPDREYCWLTSLSFFWLKELVWRVTRQCKS